MKGNFSNAYKPVQPLQLQHFVDALDAPVSSEALDAFQKCWSVPSVPSVKLGICGATEDGCNCMNMNI